MHLESCSLSSVAEQVATPFYCYSKARILQNTARCQAAFSAHDIGIHYAMKANSNLHILHLISSQGLGVDTVSAGEIQRAIAAGIAAEKIIFSGVGKSAAEIRLALDTGIGQFNVESAEELALLSTLAQTSTRPVRVALRVNPDVTVNTHRHITTGTRGNKFGMPPEQALQLFRDYADHACLNLCGLAMHIGSQICEAAPYRQAVSRLLALTKTLKAEGVHIRCLDLGGGFGIDYGNGSSLSFSEVAQVIADTIHTEAPDYDGKVVVEPGRSLVADAGVLVTRVNFVKEAEPRPFLILDAAMNDLMRPALYQAVHPLLTVSYADNRVQRQFDVVGPVCESTDTFARDYPVSEDIQAGDLMAFLCAGAYCSVMSNSYNSREIPAEVLVDENTVQVIRRRISQEELMAFED
nr:diaminopimelate decarboxylase [Aliamphritea spongicola]